MQLHSRHFLVVHAEGLFFERKRLGVRELSGLHDGGRENSKAVTVTILFYCAKLDMLPT